MTDTGTLAIVASLPYGIINSLWWTQILPEITKRYVRKYPTVDQWNDIFSRCKFMCVNKLTILGSELYGPSYLDGEGPLKKEWRNSMSYFSTATDEEINAVEEKINKMKRDRTLEQWRKDNDKSNEIGTVCVFICKRVI